MKDVKPIIAENLAALRKSRGLTQAQLAEMLDYSDKAVSRWEHGDTLPDMNVLCELCDFYEVTLDYLVRRQDDPTRESCTTKKDLGNRIAMCSLMVSIVWLIATFVFVYSNIFANANYWRAFIWAVPITFLIVMRGARTFGTRVASLIASSGFVWTFIAAVYIQFLKYNLWLIFIIGVPAQITLVLWYNMKSRRRKYGDSGES